MTYKVYLSEDSLDFLIKNVRNVCAMSVTGVPGVVSFLFLKDFFFVKVDTNMNPLLWWCCETQHNDTH